MNGSSAWERRLRRSLGAVMLLALIASANAWAGTPPSTPARPVTGDPDVTVAPEWMRAYELKLELNAVWARVPEAARVRLEAAYAATEARFRELLAAATGIGRRLRDHRQAVQTWEADLSALSVEVQAFNARCTAPASEEQRRRCLEELDVLRRREAALNERRDRLVRDGEALNGDIKAHNERTRSWAGDDVRRLDADLEDALRAARSPLDPSARRGLEAERRTLRQEIRGLQEALRRLSAQQATEAADREEWERRFREAQDQAERRVMEFAADQTVDRGLKALTARAKAVRGDIDRALAERIDAAGGAAPDRKERVAGLDARLRDLYEERSAYDHTIAALEGGKVRVQQALAGMQAGTAQDRQEALEAALEVLGAVFSDPRVEKALRLTGFAGQFATYAKLAADSALDIANEVTAIVRTRTLDEGAERYLADVKRLSDQLRSKVERLREIQAILAAEGASESQGG